MKSQLSRRQRRGGALGQPFLIKDATFGQALKPHWLISNSSSFFVA